jgi:hypothetical protein
MASYDIWVLGEREVTISGGEQLDGVTQGDGSHLVGETITLNTTNWAPVSITDNDTDFGDNDGGQQLDGDQTIDGVTYSDGTVVEAEYSFTVTDGANTYTLIAFNVRNSSPAYGTVEGVAFIGDPGGWPPVGVELTITAAQEGPSFDSTEYVNPICFAAGTLIETPDGGCPVERLRAGDFVSTHGGGVAELRWTGRRAFRPRKSEGPVHFLRGAIGNRRDLVVSPHHRIYVEDWRAELFFGAQGVLVAAKNFVDGRYVLQPNCDLVTYVHLMFDRHEIVISEGVPSESLYPGPCAMDSLTAPARREIMKIFPELSAGTQSFGPLAATELRAHEARIMFAA